ncbi:hypothetical protein CSB37_01070 [bacterium DOLZORAL124_38_8]|nr:MAG: hypothetical protein CSB37_01070 [bacterium DOLZORAL124_38_8]
MKTEHSTQKQSLFKALGFTLIELLVVIVMIGILSGMGIAQYKKYTEKARLAKAQAAAVQFKHQALAANASLNDKLFTAWYTFDDDFQTNGNISQITDKSSNKNHFLRSNQNLSKSENTPNNNGEALTINKTPLTKKVENIFHIPTNKITFAF